MKTAARLIPLLLLGLLPGGRVSAQVVDTSRIIRAIELERELDSLREGLRVVNAELQTMKARLAEGTDIEKLLESMNGGEEEAVPEDQRSKRKRLDGLLKAISEQPGQLRFNGGVTTIIQGNPRRRDRFSTATGSLDIFAHTSFGKGTLLFFDFEAIGGNGPAGRNARLGSLNADAGSTQDVQGFDRLSVLEAWGEFSLLDDAFVVTAGKIDLTNYFDNNGVANDETAQFISGPFVNSSALPAPGNSPGIRFRTTILDRFYLQAGLASVDNSGDHIFAEIVKMGSVGFKTLPDTDIEGNVRFYGYLHPAADDGGGYGVSVDQGVVGGVTLFGRWNRNNASLSGWFGVEKAWSAGGRFVTSVSGRKLVAAAAFGETYTAPVPSVKEQLFEGYVRLHLNKWAHISAHIQALRFAPGAPHDVVVAGVRSQFNF